jgi:rubredoxin
MAVYRCKSCGYIFDEEKEGKSIRDIYLCPRCKQPDDMFNLDGIITDLGRAIISSV